MRTVILAALILTGCGSEPAKQPSRQPAALTAQEIRRNVQASAEACSTAVSSMDDALTAGDLIAASGRAQDASNVCGEARQKVAALVGLDEDGPYSDCVGMTLMGKALGDKTAASLDGPAAITDDSMQRLAENYRSSASICLIAAKKLT